MNKDTEKRIFVECLSCGCNYNISRKDIQEDELGYYVECKKCGATYNVDYNDELQYSIYKVLSKVKKEYENFIKTVKIIELENVYFYKHNLNYAFITQELISFLENEFESAKINLDTRFLEKEYSMLYEITNISESLLDVYYNCELGTSYDDIEKLLRECLYVEEEEE